MTANGSPEQKLHKKTVNLTESQAPHGVVHEVQSQTEHPKVAKVSRETDVSTGKGSEIVPPVNPELAYAADPSKALDAITAIYNRLCRLDPASRQMFFDGQHNPDKDNLALLALQAKFGSKLKPTDTV
jgi:hypothetical protein